jgi:hypothetical protein
MNKPLKTCGARAATAPTSGATHRLQRILVVADDMGIRQLVTEVLIRHGYQVDATEGNRVATDLSESIIKNNGNQATNGLPL